MKRNTSLGFQPVRLAPTAGGRDIVVSSVEDAARRLLTEWPEDDGEKYYEAVKACYECLHNGALPASARIAFVLAAQEAGLTVTN